MNKQHEEHQYFAYGLNMDADRMAGRVPGAHKRRKGTLPGHRLVFNKATNDFDGSAAANIQPDAQGEVEGVLYSLDGDELMRLDQVEGHPRHYTRRLQAVLEDDDRKTAAWVYHATPTYVRDGLAPRRAYLHQLAAGRDLLSEGYLKRLLATTVIDEGTDGPETEPA